MSRLVLPRIWPSCGRKYLSTLFSNYLDTSCPYDLFLPLFPTSRSLSPRRVAILCNLGLI